MKLNKASCEILSNFETREGRITNLGEGIIYEFKENFNWGSKEKYARVMASFANLSGGCIIFGIKNDGGIIGLGNEKFDQRDPAEITGYLNSLFVPKLEWVKIICRLEDKKVGLLYVEESNDKPIVASINGDEVKEGDIYYRYPGETRRIKQGELKSIIEDGKRKYGMKLLEEMKLMVEEGPKEFGLLDLEQMNKLKDKPIYLVNASANGKKIEMREANEGEGSDGYALKVVNVEGQAKTIRITEYKNITTEMIIHSFLDRSLPANYNSTGFLERLPYETSGLVPIYFYIKMASVSKEDAIRVIRDSKSTTRSRTTLIKRLTVEEYDFTTQANQDTLKKLVNGEILVENLTEQSIKQILISMRSITKNYLIQNWDIIKRTIYYLFDNFYMNSKLRQELRLTICFMDRLFYE